jgi:hypothetical protein
MKVAYVLCRDRPLRMAARVDGHAVAARLARARRAVAQRRADRRVPA